VQCDNQILQFQTEVLTQTQFKPIVTWKSFRTLEKLRDLSLRNAALVEIEASLGSS